MGGGNGAERVVRAGCTDCAVEARVRKSRSPLEITSSVFTGADGRRPMVREDVPAVPLYETSIESSLTADTTSESSRATVTDARFVAPAIDTTFPLKDARLAHERLEKGEQFGKVVLTVD